MITLYSVQPDGALVSMETLNSRLSLAADSVRNRIRRLILKSPKRVFSGNVARFKLPPSCSPVDLHNVYSEFGGPCEGTPTRKYIIIDESNTMIYNEDGFMCNPEASKCAQKINGHVVELYKSLLAKGMTLVEGQALIDYLHSSLSMAALSEMSKKRLTT